jgi:PAS domain S-box-containing protein
MRALACLAKPPSAYDCIREFLSAIVEETGLESVAIRLRQGDDYPIHVHHGHAPPFLARETNLLGRMSGPLVDTSASKMPEADLACLCGAVLRQDTRVAPSLFTPGGSLVVDDLPKRRTELHVELLHAYRGACVTEGFRTFALVPIHHAGAAIGLFHLADTRPARLDSADIAFFEQLGACIGVPLVQRQTEAALREAEHRFQLLVENTSDVLWVLDGASLRFRYVSPSVERQRGFTAQEVLGQTLESAFTADSFPILDSWLASQAQAETGASVSIFTEELEQPRKNGDTVWTETSIRSALDETGASIFYGVSRDISRRRAAELERKRLEQQLASSQRLEALGILAGGIAHDFNNILSVIEGWSEMGIMDLEDVDLGGPTKVRDSLDRILQASKRAKGLVEQILLFGRRGSTDKQPLHLSTILKETCRFARAALPSTIRIETRLTTDGVCMGSATHIHQAMMNLLTHAGVAMPDGGSIEVSLDECEADPALAARNPALGTGRLARIRVRDTGVGIPAEHLGRIFEPFFAAQRGGKGSGLGLSVVHGIVADHAGTIEVSSRIGMGSTFEIYLPLLAASKEPDTRAVEPQGGSERLLFVDDEEALVQVVQSGLGRLGYQVKALVDSREALRLFRETPDAFDVVVSDVTMPEVPGDLLAKEVRRLRPRIPIIMLTGMSDRMSAETAETLKIDAFLLKPITVATLSRHIRRVLAERELER